jgi:tetratricopeptide (TPR) repeat protein
MSMENSRDAQKTVLILGDSTSMTVGFEQETWTFHLASMPHWSGRTVFVNCSQPGITSSDAAAFFFNEGLSRYRTEAVIVYLGNVDANASELKKGVYSRYKQWRQGLMMSMGIPYRAISLKNRLLRFEWNDHWDPRVEAPESPASFESNLNRIFSACKSRNIPVVVVKPLASRLFPAGMGKGNFIFYSYLDIPVKIADELLFPDARFIDARRSEERGDHSQAMSMYGEILDHPPADFRHPEYPLILVNNYAVCAARAGQGKEALRLLTLLLRERSVRREIVLYNLACFYRSQGRIDEAEDLFTQAYDADVSLYRVKEQYRQAIDRLSVKFSGIASQVDMAAFADVRSYVDHCHLLPEKQRILAASIKSVLDAKNVLPGDQQAGIENALFNPELALGNRQEFFTYYKTYAPFSSDDMRRQIGLLRAVSSDRLALTNLIIPGVSSEMVRAFRYYLDHPCFPSAEDVFRHPPDQPADIGRFPELYLARYLVPYVRLLEGDDVLMKKFLPYIGIWHGSEELLRLLPSDIVPLMEGSKAEIDLEYDGLRVGKIINRVEEVLRAHLKKGPQVGERLMTTIFWYFRELLRWGSHSRISMRYDRRALEYCMEALIVAAVLDKKTAQGQIDRIIVLASEISQIVTVHETWCSRLDLTSNHSDNISQYKNALDDINMRLPYASQ